MRIELVAMLLAATALVVAPGPAAAEKDFGPWWYDGKAELKSRRVLGRPHQVVRPGLQEIAEQVRSGSPAGE